MRREKEEPRERYVAAITMIYKRARDIALAAYDGVAAADEIANLAETIHGANTAVVARSRNSEATTLHEYGSDRGSSVHLAALIALRGKLLDAASSDDERGIAHDNLGTALQRSGRGKAGRVTGVGGRGLPSGTQGMDARSGAVPMGGDPEQPRHRAL
jgi:hypothetical protein